MNKILDRFVEISTKLGNQIHLKSIRDAIAITMPLTIVAGFMTLINSMILDSKSGLLANFVSSNILDELQEIGKSISNGTLGMWTIAMAFIVAFCLARNKKYDEPIIAGLVSFSSFIVLIPLTISVTPVGAKTTVDVMNILTKDYVGVPGMFTGIIVGILSTEIFVKLTKIDKLKINMPDDVPTMVAKSFNNMIPLMLVVCFFGILSFALNKLFGQSFNEIIVNLIQTPIRGLTTSLPGFLFAMVLFNLLFAIGIHPTGIIGAVINPALLLAINENMDAIATGTEAQNIISITFREVYGQIGGTGCTLCLIIAVFLWSKRKEHKKICQIGLMPSIFNINEPIIFGFPIVFNPIMIIPFILVTQINYLLAYAAAYFNLISKCVVQIPWTTPPIISAYLSTNGDFRAAIFHALLIVLDVLIYLLFLKMYEKSLEKKDI